MKGKQSIRFRPKTECFLCKQKAVEFIDNLSSETDPLVSRLKNIDLEMVIIQYLQKQKKPQTDIASFSHLAFLDSTHFEAV